MSNELEQKPKYHLLRRTVIFFVLLLIDSLVYTHTALNGSQVFADASLIILLILCFGLRKR